MSDTPQVPYTGPRRILSGIQASGALHLGNYLGALKRFVALQEQGDPLFVFVADMHAITVWQDPALLTQQTREIAASRSRRCPSTPNWPGSSTASPASAGSTA
jgi:tryptophanyl-tRNA synthetase